MGEVAFPSLQQKTIHAAVVNAIRDRILSGELRSGEQLGQAEIAAQMNISRAPVREALRQLEEEGLVESIPYKGTFVARITRQDILELGSLRGMLEAFAIRLAMARADGAELRGLEGILGEMRVAAAADDYEAVTAGNVRFHSRICLLSGHRHLLETWERKSLLIRRILAVRNRMNIPLNPPQVAVESHQPFVEAVLAGDVEAAQRLIEEHCNAAAQGVAASWPEDDSGSGR